MRSVIPRSIVLALIAGAIIGCAPANERPDFGLAIESAVVQAGNGGRVDLGNVVSIDWDTVYGFPGETTDGEVTTATGADFGSGDDTRAPGDGLALAVFVDKGTIAAWVVLNRDATKAAVRFDQDVYARPVARSEAIFTPVHTEMTVGGLPIYRLFIEPRD